MCLFFFFQAEDGIRDSSVTGVQTCALPICLGAQVGLRQRRYRIMKQLDGDPAGGAPPAVLGADDRAVMTAVHGEFSISGPSALFERYGDSDGLEFSQSGAISVIQSVRLRDDGFGIFVDGIAAVRRVHPAVALVESLIDEELPPGHRAIDVQSLLADHLQFVAEV